jgi:hypothetical protein
MNQDITANQIIDRLQEITESMPIRHFNYLFNKANELKLQYGGKQLITPEGEFKELLIKYKIL